jgi:hypothetical protein
MNYAIVEDDSEQDNSQATFTDNFYGHQPQLKQHDVQA